MVGPRLPPRPRRPTVALAGLQAPVEILTDTHGVPAVYARDPEDAWFAAGVLHARDRRWQMELYRRVTLGRLSEVLGDTTIPFDQRFLTLGLRDAAKAEWERATPQVRAGARAICGRRECRDGADGRAQAADRISVLGITPPAWEPIDSLAVGRLLAWRLAENHQAELVRAALAAKFGETRARFLTGALSIDRRRRSCPASPKSRSRLSGRGERSPAAKPIRVRIEPPAGLEWLASGARRGNSNNWVLAGGRTKSGRPILANDPHLQIEFPSVWYEMHLVASGLDVIGVTIPGVPFIALGHNARIAWGMTATGADVQDLALERVDIGKKRSMYRGEWVPIETVTRPTFPCAAAACRCRSKSGRRRNGPIFADVDVWTGRRRRRGCRRTAGPSDERRAYSLRWDAGGDLAAAFEAINRASDWTSFTDAIASFAAPSMNIVYADVDGNVGYAMSGRLPVRAQRRRHDAGRRQLGAGVDGDDRPGALPRVVQSAVAA